MQLDQFNKTYCTQCGAPEPLVLADITPTQQVAYGIVTGHCECCGADHFYLVQRNESGCAVSFRSYNMGNVLNGSLCSFFAPTLAPHAPTAKHNLSAALMRLRMRQVRNCLTPSDMLLLTLLGEGMAMLAALLVVCAILLLGSGDLGGGVASVLAAVLATLLFRAQSLYFVRDKKRRW